MIGDYNTDNKCLLINLLKNAKLYIIKYRSNSQNINKVINYLNSVVFMSYTVESPVLKTNQFPFLTLITNITMILQ